MYITDTQLAAADGSSLVGFAQAEAGAQSRTVENKLRERVSLFDFGAVGDGTTDDTYAVAQAIATGKDVLVPRGYIFAITGNVTGFANGQRIFGGGGFKKLGTIAQPMFLLPDESRDVWFDGIEFDGSRDLFAFGSNVSAILGHLTDGLTVTKCHFHDIVDVGIKLRDSANLHATGNTLEDIWENGIELHNYPYDPRLSNPKAKPPLIVPYEGTRPVIEGNHTIIGNIFRRITRYENPAGPLVDACGIGIFGASGHSPRNIRIIGNHLEDCLRFIASEQNDPDSEVDGLVISGNTLLGGVAGGPSEEIYGKVGIMLVGVHNAVVTNNVIRNPANHDPLDTETAAILISASFGLTTSENIEISGNICVEDTDDPDRTEHGIYVLIGNDIRIHDNRVSGFADAPIFIQSYATSVACYANEGAQDDFSWRQVVPLTFTFNDIPASTSTNLYPAGLSSFASDPELILPCAGRVVGMAVLQNSNVQSGNVTYKVYANNFEQAGLTIDTADFAGSRQAIRKQPSTAGDQLTAGQRVFVNVTTDSAFPGSTTDVIVSVYLDIGFKQ